MSESSGEGSRLTITITGYTDVTGHTEYIIKTAVGEQTFAVQHRFSDFIEVCAHYSALALLVPS